MKIDTLKKGISYLRYYGVYAVENTMLYGGKMLGRFLFPLVLIFGKVGNIETFYPESILKNKTRIFFEQLWYILKTGEINKYYHRFGFDRKSKSDFKNYVPWLVFTNARNRRNQLPPNPTYDPYNYICMLRDKFVFEAFCKRVGIKTPSNIGMINDGNFHVIDEPRTIPLNNIVQLEIDAFLKRNVSYGGGMSNNVMPLRIENGIIYLNNRLVELDDFKEFIGSDCWVLQERITNQHEALSKFHPSSINTLRIVTVKVGSTIEVISSNLRIGKNGRHADNVSSGGVSIPVANGKLEEWGFIRSGLGVKIDKHPNTKVVFENYEIPFWDKIIDTVKNAHSLFYGIHSIGWDVCLTDNGIKLIEGNDNWDTIDAQISGYGKNLYLKYFKD